MNNNKKICVWLVGLGCFFGALGCSFSGYYPSSDTHSPIDLSDESPTARQIRYKGTMETHHMYYSWRARSGRKTDSSKVEEEIHQYLGGGYYWDEPRISIAAASWYWAPELAIDASISSLREGALFPSRPDTIVILAINPTVILRVERPTVFRHNIGDAPWYSEMGWWGWDRRVLRYGIADGLVIPVVACDDPWPYFTEIIIPSSGFRESIDLNMPGVLESEIATIRWSCVSENKSKSYIKFDIQPN